VYFVTSTRGKGIFTALAICAALLVPAAATADSSYSGSAGSAVAKRVPFSINFTSLTRNGHIVAVKQFKFVGVKANCNGGKSVSIHGRFPRMQVANRKFGDTITKNGGTVKMKAQFRDHGQKVNGRFRVDGKFSGATGCFGVRNFRASQG
jgi:hypothetical protein